MKKAAIPALILTFVLVFPALAVKPQKWELMRIEQFLQGKFEGISVSYEGDLFLSPREEILQGPGEEFYLSMVRSQNNLIYLGTGHSGRIYRIGPDNKAEVYYQMPEMDVSALVWDGAGTLYAATSPNGKIYKITGEREGSVFFDPDERYIWDLEYLGNGALLAAVGETGGIYSINNLGEGNLILKAKENHILCLERTANGDLYAGSGGKGRLYRMTRNHTPSILFESPFEEIRSLAFDGEGNIYAAAGGKVSLPSAAGQSAAAPPVKADAQVAITVTPQGSAPVELSGGADKQPSTLFKINAAGIAKKLWSSNEDIIYSLFWDERTQRVIFGTGNRGRIFAIDRNEKASLLLQKESEQVFVLKSYEGRTFALSNNPPALSVMFSDQRYKGEYLSQVFDAGLLSSWGRIEWTAEMPQGTTLQVLTRSGNSNQPSQTWSNWSPPYQKGTGEQILNPAARYLQFKILFETDSGRASPRLDKISLFFLQTNVAPEIMNLGILPVNVVFIEPPMQDDKIWGLDTGANVQAKAKQDANAMVMAKKTERKGYQTVVWQVKDENNDGILYNLSVRKRGEEQWRLVAERMTKQIFSFETMTLPDGEYEMKLEADDSPSNPEGRELKAEKISRVFVIDNSLPLIRSFQAQRSGSRLNLKFVAADSFSRIKEVQYLVRPGEWSVIFPEDGICDSKQESFEVGITLPTGFDNMVTVKVVDEHGNIGVQRAVF
jgi:hypothetical protein